MNNALSNSSAYALHVLDPEKNAPTRIPSEFPIETALLSANRTDILSTDAAGNLIIRATVPDITTTSGSHSVSYCNDGTWNVNTNNDAITAIGTIMPGVRSFTADEKYRLVAYKIKLTYIGAQLYRSGAFIGAHDFGALRFSGLLTCPSINQLQDCPAFYIGKVEDGLEVCYKPYDNSYLEFSKTTSSGPTASDNVYTPYTIVAAVVGGQASTACVLVEQFVTVEYIPAPVNRDQVETQMFIGSTKGVSGITSDMVVRPVFK